MDRELASKLSEGLTALKSVAESLDKLVNEPLVQIESPPPSCPFCGKVNPIVRIDEEVATGNLAEFVLEATCQDCENTMYGVVVGWNLFNKRSDAALHGKLIAERHGVK